MELLYQRDNTSDPKGTKGQVESKGVPCPRIGNKSASALGPVLTILYGAKVGRDALSLSRRGLHLIAKSNARATRKMNISSAH